MVQPLAGLEVGIGPNLSLPLPIPVGGTLSQPPEIDDFPTSLSVLPGTRMVLRAEVTSTTSTMYTAWRHGNKTYSHFIEEDPFCNHQVEVSAWSLQCMQ